jgi:hypothetical protein
MRRLYAQSLRRIEPLWAALSDLQSDVHMKVQTPRKDPEFELQRRVVEIWDARSRLREWLDPAVRDAAFEEGQKQGLDGDRLAAAIEAALWREALARRAAGNPPAQTLALAEPGSGNDLAGSVQFLELIAEVWDRPLLTPTSA